jgi:hypothetical protein
MLRRAMLNKELCDAAQHIIRLQSSFYNNGQALTAVLINDREHLDRSTIVDTICHKIIRPDMVSMGRSKTNTRPVIEPKTPPFRLFLWNFETLLPPDPFDPLVVDPETLPL